MFSQFPTGVWLTALASIALSACAQLLMKFGMSHGRPASLSIDTLFQTLFNPWVFGGLACYGVSALLWLSVLARLPLSLAYPLVSVAIVSVVVLSALLFGEKVSVAQVFGVALVCLGVMLIGLKA